MTIPLEITYFYPLHFVMGVCKQRQMPTQFATAFLDALSVIAKQNGKYGTSHNLNYDGP